VNEAQDQSGCYVFSEALSGHLGKLEYFKMLALFNQYRNDVFDDIRGLEEHRRR